jgi:acetylornithine/succinyldiaminopimelate/putrescine aminotransferase
MKRLSKFEVESLVNVVMSKLDVIESEKIKSECSEKVDEWCKELEELDKEKNIILEKINERGREIGKEIKENGWKGVYVNVGYGFDGRRVRIEKNNLIGYEVRSKISDEIVINSLKENDIDVLLDSLVNKFKS